MLGAIILAGGPSSRFGRNKAFIGLNGKPLLRYVADECRTVAERIIVAIGKDDSPAAYTSILPSTVEVIRDSKRHKNPLNGIASGIRQLDATYSLVLPCDTPLVKREILQLLTKEASGSDAAVPLWPNGFIEPLHAVYRVEATRRALERIMKNSNSSVSSLASALDTVRYVGTEEIRKLDRRLGCFFNINSFLDLKLAKNMLEPVTTSITV